MALTLAQKGIIEASINHLLDFSPDDDHESQQNINVTPHEKIKNKVKELKYAIEHQLFLGPFSDLTECLLQPTKIPNLEKYNNNESPLTIGEVQLYIIELITAAIKEEAKKINTTSHKLGWYTTTIKQWVITEQSNILFTSIKPKTENIPLPWQFIHEPGSIYFSTLQYSEDFVSIRLLTFITINNSTLSSVVDPFRTRPEYDSGSENANENDEENEEDEEDEEDESTFLLQLIPEAQYKAKKIALEEVIEYLTQHSISETMPDALNEKPFLSSILLNKFYLTYLINGKINSSELIAFNEEETINLIDPIVMKLLEDDLCSIHLAKSLNIHERKVIAAYYSFIFHDIIGLADIIGINGDQQKILVLPIIKNVITEGKLSFSTAKSLPAHLFMILTDQTYMDFLQKENIDWKKLTTTKLTHCQTLLSKPIVHLVKEKIFSLTDVLTFTPELTVALLRENINSLLLKKTISIDDLKNVSINTIDIIDSDIYLCEWMMNELIQLDDIHPKDLQRTYSKPYAKRLLAILQNSPYTIDKRGESVTKIHQEIISTANFLNVPAIQLTAKSMERFIRGLITIFNDIIHSDITITSKVLFNKFADVLKIAAIRKLSWTETLAGLIDIADNMLDDLKKANVKKGFSVFENNQTALNELKLFCLNIKLFSVFISPRDSLKDNIELISNSMMNK